MSGLHLILLAPLPHGAAGPWDEVINLIPLVIGGALLLYLYLTSKKRREREQDKEEAPEQKG
jgi:hypothetical protein